MTLTRANVEQSIVDRLGAWLTAAQLDGSTIDGTNASLREPIARAVRKSDGTVVDMSDLDAALASVPSSVTDAQVLDLVEYYTLSNIYQNYTDVDVAGSLGSSKDDQLRQAMRTALQVKAAEIASEYGIIVTGGSVSSSSSRAVPIRVVW